MCDVNTLTPGDPVGPCRRTRDRGASEQRMLDAAVTLFNRHGYDAVTVRMIAAEAQVNVALINRYFGSKLELFAAAVAQDADDPDLAAVTESELPRWLAEYAIRPRQSKPALRALFRSAGAPEVKELWRRRVEAVLVERIAARLSAPDARARARMATMVLMGVSLGRSIFAAEDLSEDDLAERLAVVLRGCLLDPAPGPGGSGGSGGAGGFDGLGGAGAA